jgi:hypothetical protein
VNQSDTSDHLAIRAQDARIKAAAGIPNPRTNSMIARAHRPMSDLSVSELISYRTSLRDGQAQIHVVAERLAFNDSDIDAVVTAMIGEINRMIGALT